jgi:hypothetical protein
VRCASSAGRRDILYVGPSTQEEIAGNAAAYVARNLDMWTFNSAFAMQSGGVFT